MKVRKRIRRLILVIAATLIAYLFLVPLLFMVFTSFKGLSESISSSELLPKMWTLENYISILENTTTSPIMRWLANTIVVTVTGTVLVVAVDCFAAYALARLDLPFKKKVIVFLIWVMTIPGIVTTFPAFYLFRELDLVNSFIPLIVPYSANATGVYLIYNFLVDFPVSLEEAARIDGAGEFRILWKLPSGVLLMTWSCYTDGTNGNEKNYVIAGCISRNGSMEGPWEHLPELLLNQDAGHAALFRDLDNNLKIVMHGNDAQHGSEYPVICDVQEEEDKISLIWR